MPRLPELERKKAEAFKFRTSTLPGTKGPEKSAGSLSQWTMASSLAKLAIICQRNIIRN